jgi:metal-dependent amidase/aminoacylase/carboxypeptidase family protein
VLIGAYSVATSAGAAAQPTDVHERVAAHVAANAPSWVDFRRDLHRHPELSGEESRTADVIAARLRSFGLVVQTGVGGYGVVGVLTGNRPGPLVAFRADMDAVRSTASDPVEFASTVPGVRHICGHDLHVTVAVALASALSSVQADLAGSVMFIFQPAEERATGARAMLDDGLFDNLRPSAVFGVHTSPQAVGTLSSRAGQMMFANQVAPGVTNAPALYARSMADLTAVMGPAAFVELSTPPQGFSEDFGAFQTLVPGVFFFLGAGDAAMPHSPGFVLDEAAIAVGVRAMAAVVVGALSR